MENIYDRIDALGEFTSQPDDDRIICRCEGGYQLAQSLFAIGTGGWLGMGLCQGQTCAKLVKGIVARELGVSPAVLEPATSRAPMRPLEMKIFAKEGEQDV